MERSDAYLLRPAEVIEMLGVSRSWLYDAAKSGRIPCVRLGGADGPVRFRASELDAWVEQGRVDVERSDGRRPVAREPRNTVHAPRQPQRTRALQQLQLAPPEP